MTTELFKCSSSTNNSIICITICGIFFQMLIRCISRKSKPCYCVILFFLDYCRNFNKSVWLIIFFLFINIFFIEFDFRFFKSKNLFIDFSHDFMPRIFDKIEIIFYNNLFMNMFKLPFWKIFYRNFAT